MKRLSTYIYYDVVDSMSSCVDSVNCKKGWDMYITKKWLQWVSDWRKFISWKIKNSLVFIYFISVEKYFHDLSCGEKLHKFVDCHQQTRFFEIKKTPKNAIFAILYRNFQMKRRHSTGIYEFWMLWKNYYRSLYISIFDQDRQMYGKGM